MPVMPCCSEPEQMHNLWNAEVNRLVDELNSEHEHCEAILARVNRVKAKLEISYESAKKIWDANREAGLPT